MIVKMKMKMKMKIEMEMNENYSDNNDIDIDIDIDDDIDNENMKKYDINIENENKMIDGQKEISTKNTLSVESCDIEQYDFKQSAVIVTTSEQPESNIVQLKQNQQMDNNNFVTSSIIKQEHQTMIHHQLSSQILQHQHQNLSMNAMNKTDVSTTQIISTIDQSLCQQLDPNNQMKLQLTSNTTTTEMINNFVIFWIYMIIQIYTNSTMNPSAMNAKMVECAQLLLTTFIEHICQMSIQQIAATNHQISLMIGLACQKFTMKLQTFIHHHIIAQNLQQLKHPPTIMNLYSLIFQQWEEFLHQI